MVRHITRTITSGGQSWCYHSTTTACRSLAVLHRRSPCVPHSHARRWQWAPPCTTAKRHCSDTTDRSSAASNHLQTKYVLPADTHTLIAAPRPLPTTNPADIIAFKKQLMKSFPQDHIRNISIVAHVDHGKTTLTDALLRRAGLLPAEGATGTFTDRLVVERERGITIKAQTCSVLLRRGAGAEVEEYLINLIDTPGHVDFQYEVSRSLSASEGAVLLVDVAQGVEAQTMAQFYAALEHELSILPVLTKMDTVLTDDVVDRTVRQLEDSTGLLRRELVFTSAKAKAGMESVFDAIIDRVEPPSGKEGLSDMRQLPVMHPDSEERRRAEDALVPLRALLFDCWTAESSGMMSSAVSSEAAGSSTATSATAGAPLIEDGVYCLVRIVDGTVTPGTVVTFFHSRKRYEVRDVGIIHPSLYPTAALTAGMVGYVFLPGLTRADLVIGDTLCTIPSKHYALQPAASTQGTPSGDGGGSQSKVAQVLPIPGFKQVQPVVFAGFYPDEGDRVSELRAAVDLLCINDPSVTVEALQCQALGSGLQLGFLGLLHMQVFKERLLAEFGQSVLITPPQVQYMCVDHNANPDDVRQRKVLSVSTWRWPHEGVGTYLEPVVHATVVTPKAYFNGINKAALVEFRGTQEDMRVIDDARILVRYHMPLADLARGFFSVVKSSSHGYATLDYDDATYVPADLVKLDIVINKARISALSVICPRNEATQHGKRIVSSLKDNLTRSSVDLPLQALVGNKIVARETIKAYRKDVTAKIHAGDITRKQKKWNDQKKGKERMARRSVGTVTLDQSVLAAAMGASTMA